MRLKSVNSPKIFWKRYRYVVITVAAAIIVALALYFGGGGYREFLYLQMVFAAVSVIAGVVLSNFTEKKFAGPAERFLNIMTGYGNKDKDSEYGNDGVPIVSLRRLMKKYYSPVSVAVAGFKYRDAWQKNRDAKQFEYFINCTDSLAKNLKIRQTGDTVFGIWEHDYPWSYGLNPPWVSALAQGFGVQLLGYAYAVTFKEKYKNAAELALSAFFIDANEGGITFKDGYNEWWYEEYVGKTLSSARVLNGMMYALVSLNEYFRATGSIRAQELFDKGIASLKRRLMSFDAGWWTCYDDSGLVATRQYHNVHLELLDKLCRITRDPVFFKKHEKWLKYRRPFFIREFIVQRPSWHDLAILLLNIGVVMAILELAFIFKKI